MPRRSFWPRGGLWRDSDFLKLWASETVSVFGSQFGQLALPLFAVLVLDASAFEVAALWVVAFVPFILFAIPAGVWVDRLRRRPLLVGADLARAGLWLSIPLAYALDVLALGQLYLVAFLVGVCTVFFDVSYQAYLPSLVDRTQLVDGNSKLELSRSASQLSGPGAAGGLIGALGAPAAILLDAISFAVSAIFLVAIRKQEMPLKRPEDAARPSLFREAREGLAYVIRHPYLRPISICTGTWNLFWSMGTAILVVYGVRELRMSPELIGLAFAIGNVGPLAAALSANRLAKRIGVGPTILWTSVALSASTVLYPAASRETALPFFAAAGIVAGYGSVVYNITQVSLRQAICPDRLQGRMNSVIRFLVWGTMPIGALTGGALATWIGLRPAMWVAAVGALFTFLPILLSPVRSLGEMPEPYAEADELPLVVRAASDA